jgi:hypothetical protein
MKKTLVLFVIVFFLIYIGVSFYRGVNLSTQFDRLTVTDFNTIGITTNVTERIYKKGTKEYELFSLLFLNIKQVNSLEFVRLLAGEAEEGANVTLYDNEDFLYKLRIVYSPKRNILGMNIVNNNDFSITRHYFLNAELLQSFFDLLEE